METKIKESINKFRIELRGRTILTEAATGNFVVTPIIAAKAGARVYAYTKDSCFGKVQEVKEQTYELAKKMRLEDLITIVDTLSVVDFKKIDVVTNTGFLRPLDRTFISKLSPHCVIPLMYEPWEYRQEDVVLEACFAHGIKVYGTNEEDKRLKTVDYLSCLVLYLLLDNKFSPFSANVLLVGTPQFVYPVKAVLDSIGYNVHSVTEYPLNIEVEKFNAIVVLEHSRNDLIIGKKSAIIDTESIGSDSLVVHICGNVDFESARFKFVPEYPRPFGYMSFTADFVDAQAVVDLHAAGLKVAEGMLKAQDLGLKGKEYKKFLESNYPALSFDKERYW